MEAVHFCKIGRIMLNKCGGGEIQSNYITSFLVVVVLVVLVVLVVQAVIIKKNKFISFILKKKFFFYNYLTNVTLTKGRLGSGN